MHVGKASVLVSCTGHEQQRRARPCSMARPGPVRGGRRAEGEVEQWAENEMERELAEMTASLEQLGGLEEKEESGSLVQGSENCLREY